MKTVRSSINKNIKMILVIAAVTAVALGGLLLLIAGNNERNQIPTDPTESEEATEAATEEATTQADETESLGISKEAQELFAAKVESIADSVAVASLLETIDLKTNVANYMVELQTKDSPKSVNIRLHKTVAEADKDAFDGTVLKYAQQILALITDAEQVQWTYTLIPEKGEPSDITIYLNQQQAKELLGVDVKKYGASEKNIDALLKMQKGK